MRYRRHGMRVECRILLLKRWAAISWHKRHPRTLKRLDRSSRSREHAGQANIAGQDDSINICAIKSTHIRSWWTWLVNSSDIAESWQYRKSSLRLVVTATRTSCQPRSRTWILGVLTSLTLPGRNNSIARLVISVPSATGTKTQVPKNPLFDTFTLTLLAAGASTWRRHSGASRAVNSTGHEDIIKMYPAWSTTSASALSQWGVSEISDQEYYLRNSMIELILRGEEEGTRYSCMEERRLCLRRHAESSTLWLKLDKEVQSQ